MSRPAVHFFSRGPKLSGFFHRFAAFSGAPGFLLAIGLISTLAWWYTERQEIMAGEIRRFGEIANGVASSVEKQMVRGEQIVVGLAALANMHASEAVAFDWTEYVTRLNLDIEHGALSNVVLFDRVEPRNRAAYEARQRARGLIGYRVVPEGDRPRYFPVVRFIPSGSTAKLGYDGDSDPVRRSAIDRAFVRDIATIFTGVLSAPGAIRFHANGAKPAWTTSSPRGKARCPLP